jgi:hypothetical protein
VSVQADLFGVEVEASELVEPVPVRSRWGERQVEEVAAVELARDPFAEVVWPAHRFDRAWTDVLLARFLDRSAGFRPFRCFLCRRAVVVSAEEWQADRAQLVACSYAACGGWVQRDCERVSPEWETPPDDEEGE